MRFEIIGGTLPAVVLNLDNGETVISERGNMGWMTENVKMDTAATGGFMKSLGRAFSGDSVFLNKFTSNGAGLIAFPSSFPGSIIHRQLNGDSLICQKGAFMVGSEGISVEISFKKKLGAGLFGGEGFILQKISGTGDVFMEFDGHVVSYDLQAGQSMLVDTGNVAMFEPTVSYDIQMVKGVKNMFLGGEGLFLTKLTGPGKIWVQTMPIGDLAMRISSVLPTPQN